MPKSSWWTIPQTKYTGEIHIGYSLGYRSGRVFFHVLHNKALVATATIWWAGLKPQFTCLNWRPLR